jgi:hypothetical protein
MPEWRQEEWMNFLIRHDERIQSTLDECAVQCLSLAIVSDKDGRKRALEGASNVVMDYRGDLPNAYSPLMMGGYKIGVYGRSGWPVWTAIAPTYDLALKEAAKLRAELKIPDLPGRTLSAGELSHDLRLQRDNPSLASVYPPFINSNAGMGRFLLFACLCSLAVGAVIGWFFASSPWHP